MLKYEHIQPGQKIKAYDHAPFPGRRPLYFEGIVEGRTTDGFADFLTVRCTADATFTKDGGRTGLIVNVPMEIFDEDSDYTDEARVQVIA